MKPFDLEAAKRGEPIVAHQKVVRQFIGARKNGYIVCETSGGTILEYHPKDLSMAPKTRTVWVNLYPRKSMLCNEWYDSKQEADNNCTSERIGGKAYPVEIEE